MPEVEILERKDFSRMIELLNRCFPGNHQQIQERWKHIYTAEERDIANHLVVKEENKIVSHVGVFPLVFIIEDSVTLAGGIGGVATDEKYRGKGLMSLLLKEAIKLMQERGYALSWLGGDRKRYGYFDWENGGRRYSFLLDKRSISPFSAIDSEIKKYEGKEDGLRQIKDIHEKEEFRLKRSEEKYKALFHRAGKETFISLKNDRVQGYLTLEKNEQEKSGTVFEFGGEKKGFADLIKYSLENLEIEKLTVPCPYFYHPLKEVLFSACASWSITPQGMLRIINLRLLLSNFLEQMNKKYSFFPMPSPEKEITLEIAETGEKATLIFAREIILGEKESANKITLDRREMVRLVFGMASPENDFSFIKEYPALKAIFPLDFYLWPLESV